MNNNTEAQQAQQRAQQFESAKSKQLKPASYSFKYTYIYKKSA